VKKGEHLRKSLKDIPVSEIERTSPLGFRNRGSFGWSMENEVINGEDGWEK
jgi:hypothetical protein